jgi:hypothetical protein
VQESENNSHSTAVPQLPVFEMTAIAETAGAGDIA